MSHHSEIQKIKERLQKAKRIAVFSGAGISKESGISTFRENDGLWEQYRIEEVATPQAFYQDPDFVWNFYFQRRAQALQAKPNPAHVAISKWQEQYPWVGVITQNIDNLHRQAGSRDIQELHGNLWKARCIECEAVTDDKTMALTELPKCKTCGSGLRPHIVWFGEALDANVVRTAVKWMREADIIFVVGTSGVVEPAASFVRDAKPFGPFIVEVNLEETALTPVADISLFEKAGTVFGHFLV